MNFYFGKLIVQKLGQKEKLVFFMKLRGFSKTFAELFQKMLNDSFTGKGFKVRGHRRHRNSLKIIFDIFMRINLAIQRVNKKIDLLWWRFGRIGKFISHIKIAENKLLGNVDCSCGNIQQLTKNQVQNSICD